ncbi:MAG: ADP-forming succinate--CoA ligase subunit beta [SAR324 cluster bacterium]|jgi:succinyl-CoA synthetase beta subunit|uniref:ATP-grasp domain-containing protein n=1 Tax=marine metagenome TaxID=408172 RepID=A0A381P897_9ZZZZ|nr:ADP-forming succinate--CoA ligase subunit beta [SAR324 cluster bacterium]MDP6488556.1 ADP-forming succinate--CoA ligase subunit beta [SAR324 cluster bacterium]MDP7170092.1 ADP-forming succinate--CoA ligase subunit beta [SAR324 cluster bacterium]MDP7438241.1 ADP-forming succinate--CoA ligase subunit beta [SAR324 cluster bacterium]MDP7581912.1 ADP-forming succinate--CoA ligase subunit beta [SAR324 cluster bacterium]|tara:strand:+ start:2430 stop:3605 length:1176 start_codon:yes stop_codon:yes gene_type:complete
MKIHEYQAKQILAKYGVPVPRGSVAYSVDEATQVADDLASEICVVKAQIHAGGRGKGGGVKVSKGKTAIRESAEAILGMQLVTHQTGPQGQKVKQLLVEEGMDIRKELYCSVLVDRGRQCVVLLASTEGGMDIEEVAEKTPEKILKIFVDPGIGLRPYQASELAFGLKIDEINPKLIRPAVAVFMSLYETFMQEDCSLLEINPLVLTGDGRVIALDAKLSFDDNAMYRHKDNLALRDKDEEDPLEVEASEADLNYIKLDGSIGCMVNGAGLAMGTMDIIKSYGGDPANFLDVGGAANQENVEKAFRLITKDPNVKCILINIFGGIVRCDMVAAGVIAAFKNVNLQIPVVVRLEGTNSEEAHQLVNESGLTDSLLMADGIRDAAEKAVAAAS